MEKESSKISLKDAWPLSVYVAANRLKGKLLIVATHKNPKKAMSIYKTRPEIKTFICLSENARLLLRRYPFISILKESTN
ncbi:hypothetical protein NEOC95_001020 [Neochlamydia sp. AcF95]|nr:hypothetical protein [Neochlamydia sp. AcF95]